MGVGTTALGWILCAVLLGIGSVWLAYVRPWRRQFPPGDASATPDADSARQEAVP